MSSSTPIDNNSVSLNYKLPGWSIEGELEKGGFPLQEMKKLDETQELNFNKNYKKVAHQIAFSLADKCFDDLKEKLDKYQKKDVLAIDYFSADCWVSFPDNNRSNFVDFAKETADLQPFNDWRKGVFALNTSSIINNKISIVLKDAENKLNEIFSEFKNLPGNQLFQPSIHGFNGRLGVICQVHKVETPKVKTD